jgi:hypothetical protein
MMNPVRLVWILAAAVAAFAQDGTTPKASPADYPVHGTSGGTGIGTEYMVHSFSRGEASYLAKDYLVVEVALFPAEGQPIELRNADFLLRINGRKQELLPQPAEMVAASLAHPEWRTADPHVELEGGVGNHTAVYGAPIPSRQPYPTDPRTQQPPIPQAPKDDPSGIEHTPPVRAEVLLVEVALPQGAQKWPVSGFLYFPYTGRPASIKSLELIYGSAVLKLK